MRITALNRGGLAVFGGHYDPHRDEAIVLVRDDTESVAVTVEYPSAPTSPAKTTSGLTSTTPTVTSGTNKITFTLSAMQDGGYADVTATVGGASRKIRIRARSAKHYDDYESASELA